MKIRYPALARSALPPRHIRSRPAVMAVEAEYFVPELSDMDMPEVLRCAAPSGWGEVSTRVYRSFNGGLYAETSRSLEDFRADLQNPFRPDGVFRNLHDEIRRHIRMLDQRSSCWPDGIHNSLVNGRHSLNFDRILEVSPLITYERTHEAYATEFRYDMENWKEKYFQQADLYAIVGGRVWRRAPEPVLRVETEFSPGRITLVTEDIFSTVAGLEQGLSHTKDFHFPVSAVGEAIAFAAANIAEGESVHGYEHLHMELESPRYLTQDIYRLDIETVAVRLLRDLFQYRGIEDEVAVDVGMRKLEDVLRSNRRDRDTDAVASAVGELIDASEIVNLVTHIVPGRRIGAANYRRHVEKWFDRPIHTPEFEVAKLETGSSNGKSRLRSGAEGRIIP